MKSPTSILLVNSYHLYHKIFLNAPLLNIPLIKYLYLGTDDDIITTATITTMSRLDRKDLVYVLFHAEKNNGESKIIGSKVSKTIHFTGLRISD